MKYNIHRLKRAYIQYLELRFPRLTERSIKTKADDVFVLFHWMPEQRAWEILRTDAEHLDNLKTVLAEEFLQQRKNPRKDAAGYVRAIKEFQLFLSLCETIAESYTREPRKIAN